MPDFPACGSGQRIGGVRTSTARTGLIYVNVARCLWLRLRFPCSPRYPSLASSPPWSFSAWQQAYGLSTEAPARRGSMSRPRDAPMIEAEQQTWRGGTLIKNGATKADVSKQLPAAHAVGCTR